MRELVNGTVAIGGSSVTETIELRNATRTCADPAHTFVVKVGSVSHTYTYYYPLTSPTDSTHCCSGWVY